MKAVVFLIAIVIVLPLAGLWLWRQSDHRADQVARTALIALQPGDPVRFDLAMVSGLPEPARRYFEFSIRPGTPLHTVAEISMAGQFGLGTKAEPGYLRMTAEQVLALPAGFIWKMRAARGLLTMSGSDTQRWTRFWLMGLIPVARFGDTHDHRRSAFGRYVAEAVFWTPAALLPGPGIRWEAIDENWARVQVTHQDMDQSVDLRLAADGRPVEVSFLRWSDANPEKVHRWQPFGGYLSGYRDFGGYRLPTHIEAGNCFGTRDYFPFFIVDVLNIEFPGQRHE